MIPSPASLLAGATDPHGRHEAPEGWDVWRRRHTEDDADALTRGRHAAQPEPNREKT